MSNRSLTPCVLSIAGSDSGGCSGIQADLKTFAALGIHGLTAIAAITAQNMRTVESTRVLPSRLLLAQLDALSTDFAIAAVKIGMLGNAANIRAVAHWLRAQRLRNIVLDPLLISTSCAARCCRSPTSLRPTSPKPKPCLDAESAQRTKCATPRARCCKPVRVRCCSRAGISATQRQRHACATILSTQTPKRVSNTRDCRSKHAVPVALSHLRLPPDSRSSTHHCNRRAAPSAMCNPACAERRHWGKARNARWAISREMIKV